MGNDYVVDAKLSALLAREARPRNFVGPQGVTPGDSPLRPAVDEEPPDLGPRIGVGHCPFYGKGENAEEPWPHAPFHRPPDDGPPETPRTTRESPRTFAEVRHHVLQMRKKLPAK